MFDLIVSNAFFTACAIREAAIRPLASTVLYKSGVPAELIAPAAIAPLGSPVNHLTDIPGEPHRVSEGPRARHPQRLCTLGKRSFMEEGHAPDPILFVEPIQLLNLQGGLWPLTETR